VSNFLPKAFEEFDLELQEPLRDAVDLKRRHSRCVCGNPIWAVGTAMVGSPVCFTCITGEADCSSDYEVEGLHTFVFEYGQN